MDLEERYDKLYRYCYMKTRHPQAAEDITQETFLRFRTLIQEQGKESIVLLSTHIVSDVEHIADRILMVKDGQIIYDGDVHDTPQDLEQFYLQQFEGGGM